MGEISIDDDDDEHTYIIIVIIIIIMTTTMRLGIKVRMMIVIIHDNIIPTQDSIKSTVRLIASYPSNTSCLELHI